jgi:FtsP/CotA-like multicopper oxidase with cupredoxin domain
MFAPADILHEAFDYEFVSINGKSYPYTEPLEYTAGETIRWRVINASPSEHPMHLHGSFYQVLSLGDYQSETDFAPADRQSVVTQNLAGGQTMMLEWKPGHEGRWLFHCHFQQHVSSDERVPLLRRAVQPVYEDSEPVIAHQHEGMAGMNDMAGLVLAINVKPASASATRPDTTAPVHKVDLVLEPTADKGKTPAFQCKVRDGKKVVASPDASMGPPIVVTRGELTEITVLNRLAGPTTIHWHGIELDSYYDGVIGGGAGNQVTPAIAPGATFAARFTPNRAGTFIYHTHASDPGQLSGGVYGALIVLEPGENFDPEREKLLVLGSRDPGFSAKRLTLNGSEKPDAVTLNRGTTYRLRLINIAPNLTANVLLGSETHPVTWMPIAKDGAALPPRLQKKGDALLHIASGETYDFEFQPDATGEIPVEVENIFGHAKVVETLVVR